MDDGLDLADDGIALEETDGVLLEALADLEQPDILTPDSQRMSNDVEAIPMPFDRSVMVDAVQFTVTAAPNVFPSDAKLMVCLVEDDALAQTVTQSAEAVAGESVTHHLYSISIQDGQGNPSLPSGDAQPLVTVDGLKTGDAVRVVIYDVDREECYEINTKKDGTLEFNYVGPSIYDIVEVGNSEDGKDQGYTRDPDSGEESSKGASEEAGDWSADKPTDQTVEIADEDDEEVDVGSVTDDAALAHDGILDTATDEAAFAGGLPDDVGEMNGTQQVLTLAPNIETYSSEQGGEDNDELLDAYVQRMIDASLGQKPRMRKRSAKQGDSLTGISAAIYGSLSTAIGEIASGMRSSSSITIPKSVLTSGGIDCGPWTLDTLRTVDPTLTSIVVGEGDNAYISDQAVKAACQLIGFSMPKILNALQADCSSELYWYDKTTGTRYGFIGATGDGTEWQLLITDDLAFQMAVSRDYAGDEAYTVDSTKVKAAREAIANAQTIVDEGSGPVLNRLAYYKDVICNAVDYDHAAADDDNTPYGNPWQIVNVFDKDPNTNVVCEGYSKAFKYLFDLSGFSGSYDCILATGTMSGGTGEGRHMWNVVRMEDGKNYLVDVTNCDTGSIGAPDKLFMTHSPAGVWDDTYTFAVGDSSIGYRYGSDTKSSYGESGLSISQTGYSLPKWTVTIDGSVAGGTVAADKTEAAQGETVTLTVNAATNYMLEALTVTYSGGQTVALTQGTGEDENKWTFAMPGENVTVNASFKQYILGSGTCGDHLTWVLDDKGTLTISGTGEMTSHPWLNDPGIRQSIKRLVINDGVTDIECSDAFDGCSSLADVSIPDSVTFIAGNAFMGCTSLERISIPKNITRICGYMFRYCSKLKNVTIPSGVTQIDEYAFGDCGSLKGIALPEGLESIGIGAFYNCSGLKDIVIPENVARIESNTFSGCSNLESIAVSVKMQQFGDNAFNGCTALKDIFYGGTQAQRDTLLVVGNNLQYIQNVQWHYTASSGTCGRGLTWTLDDEGTLTIGGSGAMTDYASSSSVPYNIQGKTIGRVVIGNGVTHIGNHAFDGCHAITEITISGTVSSLGNYAFSNCHALATATVGEGIEALPDGLFCNCENLENVTLPAGVTRIDDSAFVGCDKLKSIGVKCGTYADAWATNKGYTAIRSDHTPMTDEAVAPTCTATGLTEGSHCSVCNEVLVAQREIPANGHTWGSWSVVWNDYSAKASHACTIEGCDGKEEKDATVTHETTTPATCEAEGVETYTASLTIEDQPVALNNAAKTKPIPATGHVWGEVSYDWDKTSAGDWKASASHKCTHTGLCSGEGGAVISETEDGAMSSEVTKAATCSATGARLWTATFKNAAFSTQTEEETIPIDENDHSYGSPDYGWTQDGNGWKATATAVCTRDAAHFVREEDAMSSERTKEPTYTEQGETTYTAVFTNNLFTRQTKTVADIPVLVKEDEVIAAENAIYALDSSAGLNDKAAVVAAREAYDQLTEKQKQLLGEDVKQKLEQAEQSVAAAEEAAAKQAAEEEAARKAAEEAAKKQAADESAAKAVTDAIGALSASAGVGDKAAVAAARAAYDSLTEDQKKLVDADVLDKLAAAEEQVRQAEEEAKTVQISQCKITVKDLTYTGKKIKKPTVTVVYDGKKLKEGTNYTVSYDKNAKKIGTYKLTVKGKGKYTGSKKVSFRVIPKGTKFTKLKGGDKQITLTWKNPKDITGYEIEYSLKSSFTGARKVKIKKAKTLTATIKKLKAKKKCYVRIRTYTTDKKNNYYSTWSTAKSVRTK